LRNTFLPLKDAEKYDNNDIPKLMEKVGLHNKELMRRIIYNVKEMRRIIEKFHSFNRYINYFKRVHQNGKGWSFEDKYCLMRNLASRFEGIKETNASGFLKYIGLNIVKSDRWVKRVLFRIGLIGSEKAPYREIYDTCEKMAKEAGLKKKGLAVVDEVLWAYSSLDAHT